MEAFSDLLQSASHRRYPQRRRVRHALASALGLQREALPAATAQLPPWPDSLALLPAPVPHALVCCVEIAYAKDDDSFVFWQDELRRLFAAIPSYLLPQPLPRVSAAEGFCASPTSPKASPTNMKPNRSSKQAAGRLTGARSSPALAPALANLVSAYAQKTLTLEQLWFQLQAPEIRQAYAQRHQQPLTLRHLGDLLNLAPAQRRSLAMLSRHEAEGPAATQSFSVHAARAAKPQADVSTVLIIKSSDDRQVHRHTSTAKQVRAFVSELTQAQGCDLSTGFPSWVLQERGPKEAGGFLVFTKQARCAITPHSGTDGLWPVRVHLQSVVDCPTAPAQFEAAQEKVARDLGDNAAGRMALQVEERVQAALRVCRQHQEDLYTDVCTELQQGLLDGVSQEQLESATFPQSLLRQRTKTALARAEAMRAQALLGLEDYPQAYPVARRLNRQVHFRVGPTNSGKTHDALEALKAAKSGLYLAPLRLLALEIRDRLVASGVPCNLVTGEERDIMPGAQHTACTVEMLPADTPVEVAVLDEIQMLQDPGRGWAWTAALVGAPAKTLYVCGDESVLSLCQRLVASMGERQWTRKLTRKTALSVEQAPVARLAQIQAGDAVVAFSRRDVLSLSARLRDQGLKVATLYSALVPEVRRAEAARFSSGEASVVVSTDVISMGLNLPIRRVVFSTSQKFDGTQVRPLTPSEVRQIAGRAGRYGLYPEGFVSAMADGDLRAVRGALKAPLPTTLSRLPLGPSRWHVEQLSAVLGSTQIGELLEFFSTRIAVKNPLFQPAAMEDFIALGHLVDGVAPDMDLADKYDFACAPASHEKPEESEYFLDAVKAHAQGVTVGLSDTPGWVSSPSSAFLEEAERLSKRLGLYAWLSLKFPETFASSEHLAPQRAALCQYIERALLTQGADPDKKTSVALKKTPKSAANRKSSRAKIGEIA